MSREIDREPIKKVIDSYQKTHNCLEFVNDVDNRVYMAEQVWHIVDQLFDLLQQCEHCTFIKGKINFKDLY